MLSTSRIHFEGSHIRHFGSTLALQCQAGFLCPSIHPLSPLGLLPRPSLSSRLRRPLGGVAPRDQPPPNCPPVLSLHLSSPLRLLFALFLTRREGLGRALVYLHFHCSPAAGGARPTVRPRAVETSSDEGSTLPGRSHETRPDCVVRQGLSMLTWFAPESHLVGLAPDSGALPLWSPLACRLAAACRVGCDTDLPVA